MIQENNKNIEEQIIDIFNKAEPILLASAEEVMKIQDQATEDFKKAQILIKEELIKDESISEEELEEVYLLRLEEVKKALEERAELQLKELEAKYIK